MSRHIDADELIEFFDSYPDHIEFDVEDIKSIINEQDTAAVVEVVRCKDCKHNYIKSWNQGKRDNPICHFTDFIRSNEFYCGFGERADT